MNTSPEPTSQAAAADRRAAGRSLRVRLALWLSASITAVAVMAGAYAFWQAFDEVHELQDDLLRQVAALVRHSGASTLQALQHATANNELDIDDDTQVLVQALGPGAGAGAEQESDADSGADADIDADAEPGDGRAPGQLRNLHTLHNGLQTIRQGGTSYRVLVHSLPNGQRFAVLQETSLRNEMARNSAMLAALPLLLLVPLLVLLTVLLVHRMLKPVAALAQEVDARSDTDLRAIDQNALPNEIRPFVHAINRLLARVEQAMAAQRRFVADAAHELRSPMTALSLQAQRLAGTPMSDAAQERLHTLQQGIDRNRRLLDQLLAMARAQEPSARVPEPVSLHAIFRQVLEDLMPLAEARHIDLGMAESADAADIPLRLHAVEISTVLKNLVDNAIRYAPDGGQVDLSARLESGSIVLEVEDNGPGIPAAERARVLDAFYRIAGTQPSGSGLGLSIAKTLVDRWGGHMELRDAVHFPTGLLVRIRLPERLAA